METNRTAPAPFRVSTVWLFLGTDPKTGEEGCVQISTPNGQIVPLIAFDELRLNQYRPLAASIAHGTKVPIRLVRFTVREDLDDIQPIFSAGNSAPDSTKDK